jgi:hypothetical protein
MKFKKFILSILLFGINAPIYAQKIDFQAKGIIALIDNDMAQSVLVDGKTLKEKNAKDNLFSFRLPIDKSNEDPKPIFVSNSFLSMNDCLAISPNGKIAFIAETKTSIPDSVSSYKNVDFNTPAGQFITVVDISEPNKAVSKFKIPVGKNPLTIKMDSSGIYLGIVTTEYDKEFVILELDENGKPIKPLQKPSNLAPGRISDIAWHPSGNYFSIINDETHEVVLIKVLKDLISKKAYRLEIVGRPIKVGNRPFNAKFTPDGKHLIINDLNSFAGKSEKGKLFSLKIDFTGSTEHILLSSVATEAFCHGFDISSDGKMIAVASPKTSFYPLSDEKFNAESEILLYTLENDGSLKFENSTKINGSFANSIFFDKNAENLAVNVSEFSFLGKKMGGIQFFKVNKITKSIAKQEYPILFTKGCHSIGIIK